MASPRLNLQGRTFGRLVVVQEDGPGPNKQRMWRVRCACGTHYRASANTLARGNATGRKCRVCDPGASGVCLRAVVNNEGE